IRTPNRPACSFACVLRIASVVLEVPKAWFAVVAEGTPEIIPKPSVVEFVEIRKVLTVGSNGIIRGVRIIFKKILLELEWNFQRINFFFLRLLRLG
uniref:Uncharacterized protein n=1 Tax=Oryza glaberrima TaxID=4538 RepID=I1R2I4_ORYGL